MKGPSSIRYLSSKMAPIKAAVVARCALFCLVLSFNSVFCQDFQGSLTREVLLNIRTTTPVDLFPTFLLPAADLVGILASAALGFAHAVKRRRRGKRAGALVRLRRRGIRTVLPGFSSPTYVHCATKWTNFSYWWWNTETFFNFQFCASQRHGLVLIPDTALQLTGFQLLRADRDIAQAVVFVFTLTVAGV